MKSASLSKMKSQLKSYLRTCGREPVVVTENGRPIAAVIAVVDPEEIERMQLANSKTLDAIFAGALERIRRGEGLSHEEVWSRIESLPDVSTPKNSRSRARHPKRKRAVRAT